jgi:hypothetical protein
MLLGYSIVLPPLIVAAIFRDVKTKGSGLYTWHIDSIGLLF